MPDELADEAREQFNELVESVGVKRFADSLGLTTRHINRILSGASPNPIERLILCLQASQPEVGDHVLDYICQELGGHFVRHEAVDEAAVNAVRECAEAIAAISDGNVSTMEVREIREAISALSSLIQSLRGGRPDGSDDS